MPVTDAYITVAEFRERTNSSAQDDEVVITSCVKAASRFIDRETNRFFTKDATPTVRLYNGGEGVTSFVLARELSYEQPYGSSVLYLPDDISSTTGLVVKVDLDGDYVCEKTITLNTHFWVGPANAARGPEPEPYTLLEVKPDNGVFSVWPGHRRSVEVTAAYGWPAVPEAVKECTALLSRMLMDMEEAGHLLIAQHIETQVRLDPRMGNVLERVKLAYGRTPPKRLFA